MVPAALIPWLDPQNLIEGFGPLALLVVCIIVFAETGLLIGFILPGDTLLIISGVLAFPGVSQVIHLDIWWVCLLIGAAAFLGGEVGYLIGHRVGPRIFERKESGFFSVANVKRTNAFFEKYGVWAIVVARFVPIVRTFAPVAAGVGHMNYRKYSLFNLIGALLWGAGVTLAGYLLSYIPPVKDFVVNYIDLILLGAVLIAVIPTLYHTIQGIVRSRRMKGKALDDAAADDLVLDLDSKPEKTD
ncbi:MAG: VTT domain-containing protein [Rhodoglobus sp.]